MQLRVYQGEQFMRTRGWYIVASVLFLVVVALALVGGNILHGFSEVTFTWQSAFGALLLIGLAWAYRKRAHYTDQQVVMMYLGEAGITIGERTLPWNILEGFGLEIDKRTQALHNIILLTTRGNEIHTFADEKETTEQFVQELSQHIPFQEKVQLSRVDKTTRKLKL